MELNQVNINSADLARSEQFYTTLGLRLIVKNDHYLRFECPDGGSTFSVEAAEAVVPHEGIKLCFECDDLDEQYERLRSAGVEFEQPPTDMPWLWRESYLRDPNGHRICLFHAGENRRNPPWRLS